MNGGWGGWTVGFFYHLPGGLAAPVMAPAGWFDKILQGISDGTRMRHFPEQITPFFKGNDKRVMGLNVFGKAIERPFFFCFESTEEPVPDDQDAGMILIEVFQVAAMVHAVMRRCIEKKFNRLW